MALPKKIQQADGSWAVDPGTGDALIACTSSQVADQIVTAVLTGGTYEFTYRLVFGGLGGPSPVIRTKKV